MAIPPLDDKKRYPPMARWFDPVLLLKLLNNVVLSSVFVQYADRRLMIAALDTVLSDDHLKRAEEIKKYFIAHEGAVWLDWIADLGDGFNSTYAMATLVARRELKLGEKLIL